MARDPIRILVLCTGNSCRSILAEALLNDRGRGRFVACSAGSRPTGSVNPHALAKLEREGLPTEGLRSKSWDEFAGDGAPAIDIVITVCDSAAGESCPVWHGSPVRAHWGIPDPAAAAGDDIGPAFDRAFDGLAARIDMLCELPLEDFDERQTRDALLRIHDAVTAQSKSA
ncbi:MAG: arsenate reductase ArsC [Woeseiaceae bacterium]|nr:arsenate reductase ArsC [Woeseiaceae bacterium]